MVKSSGKSDIPSLVALYEQELRNLSLKEKHLSPKPNKRAPSVQELYDREMRSLSSKRTSSTPRPAVGRAVSAFEKLYSRGTSSFSTSSNLAQIRKRPSNRLTETEKQIKKADDDRSRADWERYKKRKKEQDDLAKAKQKDEDERDKEAADREKKRQKRIRRMGSLTKHLRDKEYQRAKDKRKEEEKAKEQTKSIIGTLFQKAVKEMGFKHTAIGIGQYRGARKAGMGRAKAGTLGIGMGALGYIGEAYRYAGQVNQSLLKSYGPVGQKIQGVGNMFNRFGRLFDPTELAPMAAQMSRATGRYNQRDLKARAMAERGGVGAEFTGLVGSLTQTGLKTEKTTQDILQKAFEAALASKLERGRFGEYIKGVTTLVKSIPTGAKASVSELNQQMVGLSGVGIQGARAASTMGKMESSLQKSTYLKAIAGGYGKGNVDFATAVVRGSKGFLSKGGRKRQAEVLDHVIENTIGTVQPGKEYSDQDINQIVMNAKPLIDMPEIQLKRLIEQRIKESGGTLDVGAMMKAGARKLGGKPGMKRFTTPGGMMALRGSTRLQAKAMQKRTGDMAAPVITRLSQGLTKAGMMALDGLTKLGNAVKDVVELIKRAKTQAIKQSISAGVTSTGQKITDIYYNKKMNPKEKLLGMYKAFKEGLIRTGQEATNLYYTKNKNFQQNKQAITPQTQKLEVNGKASVDVNLKGAGIDKKVQAGMVLKPNSKGKKKKIPKTQTPSQRK